MRNLVRVTTILCSALLVLSIFTLEAEFCYSQDKKNKEEATTQTDLIDIIRDLLGKKPLKTDTTNNKDDESLKLSFLPGVAYSSNTGFLIGFNLGMAKYFGSSANTSPSAATLSSNYTSKNQFNVKMKSDIYTSKNNWYLEGDWRLSLTSQPTYGLGSGTPGSNEQILFYDQLRFYQKFSKKLFGNIYAGAGFYFDRFYNVKTKNLDDAEISPNFHNEYNKKYNFDTTNYNNAGIGLLLEFDSRDNTINAYNGYYGVFKYIVNGKSLGGESYWQNAYFEFRTYQSYGKVNKHVFAFWLYGNFAVAGKAPYLSLPATGWDKYEKSGRGYSAGRFRGNGLMYGEFEYRIPLSNNGLFGAVVFINGTTTSDPDNGTALFKYVTPGYGGGLRIKFNKNSRTNVAIDYGRGSDGASSFSFNLGENF
ncbi:MAG: hypothetical protein IPG02_13275 [Ignavibacteria bacterium]|jgi:hypothetical protein|nr:hypothetical protein [Ignavibacteria bacterium]